MSDSGKREFLNTSSPDDTIRRKLSSNLEQSHHLSPSFEDYCKLLRDSILNEDFQEIHTFVVLGASVSTIELIVTAV